MSVARPEIERLRAGVSEPEGRSVHTRLAHHRAILFVELLLRTQGNTLHRQSCLKSGTKIYFLKLLYVILLQFRSHTCCRAFLMRVGVSRCFVCLTEPVECWLKLVPRALLRKDCQESRRRKERASERGGGEDGGNRARRQKRLSAFRFPFRLAPRRESV